MLTGAVADARMSVAARARAIAAAGGLAEALNAGAIDAIVEVSLSEALVLGLLKQGVRKYFAIFGHGSTDLGEILASMKPRALPAPSIAAMKWRWRMLRPASPGSTGRPRQS